jgi:hypothetical protein
MSVDKPPVPPILSDVCQWCLSCPYGSCFMGHWQMRQREYQEERKRWEERRALRPAETSKPEPESNVAAEAPRAPRLATGVELPRGVREYLASLGRRGGSSRSERKQAASRRNGHLAGQRRPA